MTVMRLMRMSCARRVGLHRVRMGRMERPYLTPHQMMKMKGKVSVHSLTVRPLPDKKS